MSAPSGTQLTHLLGTLFSISNNLRVGLIRERHKTGGGGPFKAPLKQLKSECLKLKSITHWFNTMPLIPFVKLEWKCYFNALLTLKRVSQVHGLPGILCTEKLSLHWKVEMNGRYGYFLCEKGPPGAHNAL